MGQAARAAVLGAVGPAPNQLIAGDDFESGGLDAAWSMFSSQPEGRIRVTSTFGAASGSHALIMDSTSFSVFNLNEAVWTVDLSGMENANLSFFHGRFLDEDHPLPDQFTGSFNGDGVAISDDGTRWHTVLTGDNPFTGEWRPVAIDLVAETALAGMSLGPGFQIKFQQYDNGPASTDGRGYDDIRIETGELNEDWYSLDLGDGDAVTLALAGSAKLELYDAGGARLAAGFATSNVNQLISNFVDMTTDGAPDTYFVRVAGSDADYSLVVTRNGDFESEPNDAAGSQAQDISLTGIVLGSVLRGQSDFYSVQLNSGDPLSIQTSIPAAGPGEFVNELDVGIELFDPTGTQVAGDPSGALTHTAAMDGVYSVRVFGESSTSGEYVLDVSGQSGGLAPFQVASSDPADEARFTLAPSTILIEFSHTLLPTTADATDLLIDGVASTAMAIVDGRTLEFALPTIVEGPTRVSIPAGAMVDVRGRPLEAFDIEFNLDNSPPRLVSSSIQQGETVPAGPLTYTARFDEPLDTTNLRADDVVLTGVEGGTQLPSSFDYDPATSTLTLEYDHLPEDDYTLRLLSGILRFEDLLGFDLDGEPVSFPIPPNVSGDGVAGGDFVVDFTTEYQSAPFPGPLLAKQPFGSLIYDPLVEGHIAPAGDVDQFTIDVDAGQTITVLVEAGHSLQADVQLLDPGDAVIGSAMAAAAGEDLLIQTAPATTAGTYTVSVRGLADTTGPYSVRILLNAAWELEQLGGPPNDLLADAQDLDTAFADLGFGTADRAGVLGRIVREYGRVVNLGAPINSADQDLNPALSADGLTLYFNSSRPGGQGGQDLYIATRATTSDPFGDVTNLGTGVNTARHETAPSVSADGMTLYFTSNRPGSGKTDIYVATRPSTSDAFGNVVQLDFPVNSVEDEGSPAISHDGLSLYFTSSRLGEGGLDIFLARRSDVSEPFDQVSNMGSNINSTANDSRAELSSDGLVFIFTSNRLGGFGQDDIYVATRPDLLSSFGPAVNIGPGINTAARERGPFLSADRITLLFDSDRAGGGGQSDLYQGRLDEDWFRFRLDDGDSVSLALTGLGLADAHLELYDQMANRLAIGATAANADQVIGSFVDQTTDGTADTYFARVTGHPADYSLVVTRNASFDTEPANDRADAPQDISPTGIVLGHAGDGGAANRLFTYDARSNFIFELDPRTGEVLNSFSSPAEPTLLGSFGMATTRNTLLVGGLPPGFNYEGGGPIFELDMNTGAVIRLLENPVHVSGMAVLDGEVYALSDSQRGLIAVLDHATGETFRYFTPLQFPVLDALGASSDTLLGIFRREVIQIDPQSGVSTRLGTLIQSELTPKGLGVIGDELFVTDSNGDFSQIDVYDLDTLVYKRSLPGQGFMHAIGADGGGQATPDFYSVQARAGDLMSVDTWIPAAGPGAFNNRIDVAVELIGPNGVLLASGLDGSLVHTVTDDGMYMVRVFAENSTAGEYVLRVSGHTGGLGPFSVASSDPAHGASLLVAPTEIRIDFNDAIMPDTLDASDLTIGGVPATAMTLIDGDTVLFQLPPLGEGVHELQIAGGAIVDLQRTPIEPYTAQLIVDQSPPHLTSSSLFDGDVWTGATLTYVAQFNETLRAAELDTSDVSLVGESGGGRGETLFEYDPATSRLTVEYENLPEQRYTLRIVSGDDRFEDLAGNDLDGEPLAFPLPPNVSGDGTAGGDFVIQFDVDYDTTSARDFTHLSPLGSLMFVSRNNQGLINAPGDLDDFQFPLTGGETVAAIVTPVDPGVTLSLELVGSGVMVGASGPGQPVVLPVTAVNQLGTHAVRVGGDGRTAYELDIYRNAALETVVGDSGDGNELPIDGAFVPLGSGRYGVVGEIGAPATLDVDVMVYGVQPATGHIVRIDAATGSMVDQFLAPDGLQPDHTNIGLSIAEGGASLIYVNADTDPNVLWRLHPVTGAVMSIEQLPGLVVDGLGFEPGLQQPHVFFSHHGIDVHRQEGYSGPAAAGWATGSPVGGLGGDSTGRMFGYFTDGMIHEFDPVADRNAYATSLPAPAADIEGLAFDGTHLYASTASGEVYRLDPDSGSVLDQFTVAGGPLFGLGARQIPDSFSESQTRTNVVHWPNVLSFEFSPVPSVGRDGDVLVRAIADLGSSGEYLTVDLDGIRSTIIFQFDGQDFDSVFEIIDISDAELATMLGDGSVTVTVTPNSAVSFSTSSLLIVELRYDLDELLPETDEYTLDLTGKAGTPIDIVLATQANVDFKAASLQLLDPTGTAVLATSLPGEFGGNYDRGIFGWTAPADGIYTLRVRSDRVGEYGIVVTESLVFDAESNDGPDDPLRSLNTTGRALGYLGDAAGGGGDQGGGVAAGDRYTIDVTAGQILAVRTATPMGHPDSTPTNDLDPQLAIFGPSGQPLAMDANSLDGKHAQITYRAEETGTYVIEALAESGRGEYLLEARLLAVGDMNGDGMFDVVDIMPFVTALVDPSTYHATYGFDADVLGDMDGDGDLDVDDVGAFVDQLIGQPPPPGGGAQTFRSGPYRGGGGSAGRQDSHAESVDAVYSEDGQQDWLDGAWPWIRPRRR